MTTAEQAREALSEVGKHVRKKPVDGDVEGWKSVHKSIAEAYAKVGAHVQGMETADAVDADWKAGGRAGTDSGKI